MEREATADRRGAAQRIVLVDDGDGVALSKATSLGDTVQASLESNIPEFADVVVLATRTNSHLALAQDCVTACQHVVSIGDSINDIRGLLDLGV